MVYKYGLRKMWISARRIGLSEGRVQRLQRKLRRNRERTGEDFKRTRKRKLEIREQKPKFGTKFWKNILRTARSEDENHIENRVVGERSGKERILK